MMEQLILTHGLSILLADYIEKNTTDMWKEKIKEIILNKVDLEFMDSTSWISWKWKSSFLHQQVN